MAFLSSALLLLASPAVPSAEDWPQYNGPSGDRSVTERIALVEWPDSGPPQVWKVSTPRGFSSFAIADGRAYTLVGRDFHGNQREFCVALDLETGEELWSTGLGGAEYDGGGGAGTSENKGGDGPRTTPSTDGERVYVLDSNLGLFCLDPQTGKKLWSHDILEHFDGRQIRWQNAASPLIEGEHVFVVGGGEGQSLLAFHKATGEIAWKRGDERMTHATPIAVTIHDVRQVIFYVQSGLIAVSPETGEELWRIDYDFRTSSAASPVVFEEVVYVSAGYGVGAGAWVITKEGDTFGSELLWRKRNKLMNHWSTPVCKDGFLYGMFSFKEYGDGPVKCVELATGETMWEHEGFGPGNVILVGDQLVALSDAGDVVLIEANPESYEETARARVLEGKCWSTPSYSDGQLYVRSTLEGARLDLTAAAVR